MKPHAPLVSTNTLNNPGDAHGVIVPYHSVQVSSHSCIQIFTHAYTHDCSHTHTRTGVLARTRAQALAHGYTHTCLLEHSQYTFIMTLRVKYEHNLV